MGDEVMSERTAPFPSSRLGDFLAVAAGLFGGLITGVSLGLLIWHLV
jgi:hypothetical protein